MPRLAWVMAVVLSLGALPLGAQTTLALAPQIATLDQERLYTESRFGRALEAKAEPKPAQDRHSDPTREELDAAYQRRWRKRAVEATIDGLAQCTPDEMD